MNIVHAWHKIVIMINLKQRHITRVENIVAINTKHQLAHPLKLKSLLEFPGAGGKKIKKKKRNRRNTAENMSGKLWKILVIRLVLKKNSSLTI